MTQFATSANSEPFFIHRQPSSTIVDFHWSTHRPLLTISVGEHLSTDNTVGSGVLNLFQPNHLLMMDDVEAAQELNRVLNGGN